MRMERSRPRGGGRSFWTRAGTPAGWDCLAQLADVAHPKARRGMVYRRAFPDPGLGVRILGEVTQAAADTLRLAEHIFIEELRRSG